MAGRYRKRECYTRFRAPSRISRPTVEQIGKFEVKEKIGEGGVGVVCRAYDPLTHRPVAIKTFTADLDVEPDVRSRVLREAKLTKLDPGRDSIHLGRRRR